MKVKDLLGCNPEAEIKVIMPNYISFDGKLSYGWSHGEGESLDNSKETCTEVCIFLGDLSENIGQS